jgi:hypothetical protein
VSQIAVDGSVSIKSMFLAITSVCEPLLPPPVPPFELFEFCPTQPARASVLTNKVPSTLAMRGVR